MKRRLYRILESGSSRDVAAQTLRAFLIVLILANVSAAAAETVVELHRAYGRAFDLFDLASMLFFSLEYGLRVWISIEHGSRTVTDPLAARLRYMRSPLAVVDLAVVLPFWFGLIALHDPFALSVLRVLLMFKLGRYSTALGTLGRVLAGEWRALMGALLLMMSLLVLSAVVMYYIERHAQPVAFASIPDAMWWAMSAISTVGYGDIVPATALGRFFAGVVTILGIGTYALPVGIVATAFAAEIQRRDFVVSWGMVARVPLFASLDAMTIASIAKLLRSRVVTAGHAIVRRGEPADCMYLIAAGEVEVELPEPVRLGEGDFFGELALLQDTMRNATVLAVTRCQLLILDATDFRRLLQSQPEMKAAMLDVAAARLHPTGAPEA